MEWRAPVSTPRIPKLCHHQATEDRPHFFVNAHSKRLNIMRKPLRSKTCKMSSQVVDFKECTTSKRPFSMPGKLSLSVLILPKLAGTLFLWSANSCGTGGWVTTPLCRSSRPGLEAEAKLEFDNPARETIRRSAELSGVNDIGWRGGRRQRFEIQNIEGIKEIAAELELGIFAQVPRVREVKVFAKGQI